MYVVFSNIVRMYIFFLKKLSVRQNPQIYNSTMKPNMALSITYSFLQEVIITHESHSSVPESINKDVINNHCVI